jgi:hypothetical protein
MLSLLHTCRRIRAIARVSRTTWFVTDSDATSFGSLFRLVEVLPRLTDLTIDGHPSLTDEELTALAECVRNARH